MKALILYFCIFLFITPSFAQISLFKELNTQEEGSSPANFIELNGVSFFTVKTIDGYNMWKTDGTEAGTVQFSNKLIVNISQGELYTTFQKINNELYYCVYKDNNTLGQTQLWKTDGIDEILVMDNFYSTKLFFINNQVCYFPFGGGFYKIENQQSIPIKNFISYYSSSTNYPSVSLGNQIIFFVQPSFDNSKIQVWKTNGTESGTLQIKSIDSLVYSSGNGKDYYKLSIQIGEQAYFILTKLLQINNDYQFVTEIWKTDGVNTTMVKRFNITQGYGRYQQLNLANFNEKLIFLNYSPYGYINSELWISDGTTLGTKIIRTLNTSGYDFYNRKWGILGNKFYFSDDELWQSDGTQAGTTFLKDLNASGNSNPNYFVTLNNSLFFKANNNELWQSNGTQAGTTFIQNLAKPANLPDYSNIVPEFIYTSNNQLLFSNYDETHDFELWKNNGTPQNTGLLKNINTSSKGSLGGNKKIKVGSIWYFNGSDQRGAELWKTDGTPQGTVIVKDIAPNGHSTTIIEMVAVGNTVYFTAVLSSNIYETRFFKSDGTESGTVEIPLNSGLPNYQVTPNSLTTISDKLFFKGSHTTGNVIWVSDGTVAGTHPVSSTSIYQSTPNNLIGLNNKILFISNGLWVSDGTEANTKSIFENDVYNVPVNPICLIEFNNKIYFFSAYSVVNYGHKYALWETDGTKAGTKIVKDFGNISQLISSNLIFLEKSGNRLYFRVEYNTIYAPPYFDLWTSDGTESGTYKLKKIEYNSSYINLRFSHVGNQFYLFLKDQYILGNFEIWTSDGTVNGTNKILKNNGILHSTDAIGWNSKLYFSQFNIATGYELWTTDGTSIGTYLVGEIREGNKSSFVSNIMDFNDKLLFWASNETQGKEIWQYQPFSCEGNRNYSVQSGAWDSADTWSCGKNPSLYDFVIIKSGHTITIPDNYQTTIKGISTENGANLKISQSAIFTLKPE